MREVKTEEIAADIVLGEGLDLNPTEYSDLLDTIDLVLAAQKRLNVQREGARPHPEQGGPSWIAIYNSVTRAHEGRVASQKRGMGMARQKTDGVRGGFAILVVWRDGESEYLMQGAKMARFFSRTDANQQKEFMLMGADEEFQSINVVPYPGITRTRVQAAGNPPPETWKASGPVQMYTDPQNPDHLSFDPFAASPEEKEKE